MSSVRVAARRRGALRRGVLRRRVAAAAAAATVLAVVPALSATSASAATTTTVTASEDAYTSYGSPSTNYGSATTLTYAASPAKYAFVKFDLSGLSGNVTQAVLRLYGTVGDSAGYDVQPTATNWSESTITWSAMPSIGSPWKTAAGFTAGSWATLDVTSLQSWTGASTVSFVITNHSSTTGSFSSREGANPPQLVVTTDAPTPTPTSTTATPTPTATATSASPTPTATSASPTPTATSASPTPTATSASPTPTATTTTPPPSNDPTIVVVGDIACDPTDSNYNNGAGTASFCRQRAVAAVVAQLAPTALLTIGDEQYADGTIDKFNASYDTDWGQFKNITRPVPGNHEYLSSNAAGYYKYFGSRAGDPKKGYYSYNIGAWHLIALNGECSYVGGCDAGSPQEKWLKADLAQKSKPCTLAYWHEPRYSSGVYGDNGTTFTAFWQDLYAAHADIVLNGHIHNYERFAPMDPSGQAVPDGIREWVVGTGGKGLVGFGTLRANSLVQNADTYGVLKITLHATGYDWQFVSDGSGTFTDSGSSSCV